MAPWIGGLFRRQGLEMIITFPKRHRLTSKEEAARSASTSALSPLDRAIRVPSIDFHQSDGIESRCDHLRTAGTEAPISPANSSLVGHQSMMSLKDVGRSAMPELLGQAVLKIKAKMSRDEPILLADYAALMDRMTETEEKAHFIGRTVAARRARYETQKEICALLEVDQGTYKQYETRTPLPHRLIPKFCIATGVSMEWLLSGEGKGPRREEYIKYIPKLKVRPNRKQARTRAA
jgi:hypothetical protein